jgi:hypothetical protein
MICSGTDRFFSPQSKDEREHPEQVTLEILMLGSLPRNEVQAVIRHLLGGCESCRAVTRRFWDLGEARLRRDYDDPEEEA